MNLKIYPNNEGFTFATYSKFLVADLEYRLAISTYVVYKLLQE